MSISENIKENLKVRVQRNLNRNYIKRLLRIIGSRPVLMLYGKSFSSVSDEYLNKISIKHILDAYQEKKEVAYSSLFMPSEFFHGLDIIPFLPEVFAGYTAGLGLADQTLSGASSKWFSTDLCTFHRSASGAVELDLFPKPDFIICTNLACDAAQKSFFLDAVKYGIGKNYYLIDVPFDNANSSLEYLSEQLKNTAHKVSKKMGKKIDYKKFREVIGHSNDFRKWALKVNKLRKELLDYPPNFNGLNFIYPFHGLSGTRDAAILFKKIYEELGLLLDNQKSPEKRVTEKKRLLWLHLKPYYKNDIFKIIGQHDAIVAFEEISNVYWPELDPGDPFRSLALKMLSHPLNGSIENRLRAILSLAEFYDIDGAIIFSHWGCRQSNGGSRIIKDELSKKKIKTLILDGDCVDKNNSSSGQILTRLQGFLEFL